ncbi:MAG: type II toxin-antitoxin system RelE/ParE family toxin [Planctomycetes bacterium]|nr:type II toxin-antitoxin system RelE/ParE family toxin [Planctomycetota bacterium]
MKVRFTPSARSQFLSAVKYVREDKPTAAVRFRNKVESVLKRLERFPNSGKTIHEFPDLPFREIGVMSYRFFYRIKGKRIWIVAVWHGAQLPGMPWSD